MQLLDPIFNPLLSMNPLLAIFLISLILSIIITIAYKLMTDQELMKTLKADMKAAQKQMKELKDHPEKMLKAQKQAMDKNMKYMMQSMKPTLITFLPIIIIFGWLSANFAYEPIMPGQEFIVDIELADDTFGTLEAITPPTGAIELLETDATKSIDSRSMSYKFEAVSYGEWELAFKVNNETTYPVVVLIDDVKYVEPSTKKFEGDDIKEIRVGYQKRIVLNLFGWEMGWLITYIVFSIVFSIGLRKLLRLH